MNRCTPKGGKHVHGERGHATEFGQKRRQAVALPKADGTAECACYLIRPTAHGMCRIRGKKFPLGERLGEIETGVAWDRCCLQTRGPCRACLLDDLLAMSTTIDGSDCAVIDAEIVVSSRR
jgi:hypothetical protein